MKLSELSLRTPLPLNSRSYSTLTLFFFSSTSTSHSQLKLKPSLRILRSFTSLRTNTPTHRKPTPRGFNSSSTSAPWLTKWPHPNPPSTQSHNPKKPPTRVPEPAAADDLFDPDDTRFFKNDEGCNAIDRIVLRLRKLGLDSDDDDEQGNGEAGPTGRGERLADLLRREWIRSDAALAEDGAGDMVLPWDREEEESKERGGEEEGEKGLRKRRVKPPSLAEQTLEEEELKRLRRLGMQLREKVNVAKAGLTQAVLEKIHDHWRKNEMVRLKFHELLARDMKTAHQIVENFAA